jgi:dihydrofolate synthase/folylpolyglutamate synthase
MTDHLRAHDAALARLKRLHPALIDLSLGRIERLLAALDHPERRLPPVIHVAGTNGKGSTIAFLRAIAEAAGLKVHAFTSPHLVRFAERIRLAGRLISDEHLGEVLARLEDANAGAPITFFEITTAAAFTAFAEAAADLCLVEVGLGGRYDATNVVEPAVSVIAPVDYDHREFLGDRLEAIAGEKAGILKRGAIGIVARQAQPALEVIEAEAARLGVELLEAGRDFDAYLQGGRLVFHDDRGLLDLPPPGLPGAHQAGNAGLAIAALRALQGPVLDEAAVAVGVRTASWPARMQRLTRGPLADAAQRRGADLWLDGAHNPHGARAAAAALRDLRGRDGRPLVLISGLLARKDASGFFAAFADVGPRVLTVGFEADAAADPGELAEAARGAGLQAEPCPDVGAALQGALQPDGPAPHVLICGSLYLSGEVLAMSPETWPQ